MSTSNFIIPVLILFKCKDFRRQYNSDRILSDKQLEILKRIHKRSSRLVNHLKEKKDTSHTLQTNSSQDQNGLSIVVSPPSIPSSPDSDYARHHNLITTHNDHMVSESTAALSKLLEDDVPDPDEEDLKEDQEQGHSPIKLNRFRFSIMSHKSVNTEREPSNSDIPLEKGTSNPIIYDDDGHDLPLQRDGGLSVSQTTIEPKQVDFPFSDSTIIPTMNRQPLKRAERIDRRDTLPVHPQFRTPAFRSVPRWFPFRSNYMGYFILILTTIVTVVNIILNIVKHGN